MNKSNDTGGYKPPLQNNVGAAFCRPFFYDSKIGPLTIYEENDAITGIYYKKHENINKNLSPIAKWCINELDDYFNKRLTQFTVPIRLKGTDFQMLVWNELKKIPYGETVSYKYIAEKIQNPKAVRAVGMANSKNPISIIVPCHRVIASNGKLSGYAGGVTAKSFLIALEIGE